MAVFPISLTRKDGSLSRVDCRKLFFSEIYPSRKRLVPMYGFGRMVGLGLLVPFLLRTRGTPVSTGTPSGTPGTVRSGKDQIRVFLARGPDVSGLGAHPQRPYVGRFGSLGVFGGEVWGRPEERYSTVSSVDLGRETRVTETG